MLKSPPGQLLRALRRMSPPEGSDALLLERFVRVRDESAFEELLRRHAGPCWLRSRPPTRTSLGHISYRVKDGMLRLIRSPAEQRVKPEEGDIITLHVEEKPLAEVLRMLAGRTGASIVLDVREMERAKTAISGSFSDVRLMAALRVLCDMCELQPVAVNNVFYVTSKENAAKLQKEIHRCHPGSPPDTFAPPKAKQKAKPMK